MKKEINKFPYNATTQNEAKIFLSDQICEQVVSITYRNGQIFCTIKDKITFKKKEITLSAALIFVTLFGMPKDAQPMGVPIRFPSAAESHRPAPQHFHQHAPTVNTRLDKIRFIKPSELPLSVYMMDKRFLNTPEVSKFIKKLRGGSLTEAVIAAVVIAFIWQIMGIEGFQLPIVHPNGAIVRPANGGIQEHLHHPKAGGKFTLRMAQSNQCPAHQTQISNFVKNGKVDLHQCYKEVERRASKVGCENFHCSFERFKALAVEGKRTTEISAREAISALQGDMLGYYKNTVCGNYGKGIAGPDFIVEGLGDYSHISHLEVKNPVGSAIEKANVGVSNLVSQGESIGSKISKQQVKWSNPNFVENLPHWNESESFPQSPANMLGLVDTFDVPMSEKSVIENSVINNSTNSSSVIFLNNEK